MSTDQKIFRKYVINVPSQRERWLVTFPGTVFVYRQLCPKDEHRLGTTLSLRGCIGLWLCLANREETGILHRQELLSLPWMLFLQMALMIGKCNTQMSSASGLWRERVVDSIILYRAMTDSLEITSPNVCTPLLRYVGRRRMQRKTP